MGLFTNPLGHAGYPPGVTGRPQTQPSDVRAATTAEVAAGTIGHAYVSPLTLGSGSGSFASVTSTAGNVTATGGNVVATTLGNGFRTREGANAKQGLVTLASGTLVVANTSVTANSRIFLTAQTLGTVTAPSALTVSARTPATSFTILASQLTDTSTVAYEIFEPAP